MSLIDLQYTYLETFFTQEMFTILYCGFSNKEINSDSCNTYQFERNKYQGDHAHIYGFFIHLDQ